MEQHGRQPLTDAVRQVLADMREAILAGTQVAETGPDKVLELAGGILDRESAPHLRRVVNATGILLHTGLGRAPMPRAVAENLRGLTGPCNVQMSLENGERIRREAAIAETACALTGAEDVLLVNNNAGATLLVLTALCQGKEAVVSRGELIEIGGSFRLPDIMAQSGAVMKEVGTTNKTHVRDYENAIGPETGLLLKVHRSNFSIVGFAQEIGIADIAPVAHKHGILAVDDLGCGALVNLEQFGLPHEVTIGESLEAGADVVLASTDKLIGGPQGGLIAGSREVLDRIRAHPLYRALRVCKLTLGALDATLRLFTSPELLARHHPLYAMMAKTRVDVERQAMEVAESIRAKQPTWDVDVKEEDARLGGGSLPDATIPSFAVTLGDPARSPAELAAALRSAPTPVVPRVHDDRVLLDMRTVLEAEIEDVVRAVEEAP